MNTELEGILRENLTWSLERNDEKWLVERQREKDWFSAGEEREDDCRRDSRTEKIRRRWSKPRREEGKKLREIRNGESHSGPLWIPCTSHRPFCCRREFLVTLRPCTSLSGHAVKNEMIKKTWDEIHVKKKKKKNTHTQIKIIQNK